MSEKARDQDHGPSTSRLQIAVLHCTDLASSCEFREAVFSIKDLIFQNLILVLSLCEL